MKLAMQGTSCGGKSGLPPKIMNACPELYCILANLELLCNRATTDTITVLVVIW